MLLLLQLLLEVVGHAGRVATLALELVLLVPPGVGGHERSLLLDFLSQLLELLAPAVHFLLHRRFFTLELFPRGHASRGAGEHTLHVDERHFHAECGGCGRGSRRLRHGGRRRHRHGGHQTRGEPCLHTLSS